LYLSDRMASNTFSAIDRSGESGVNDVIFYILDSFIFISRAQETFLFSIAANSDCSVGCFTKLVVSSGGDEKIPTKGQLPLERAFEIKRDREYKTRSNILASISLGIAS
jgi:hypothetical protein